MLEVLQQVKMKQSRWMKNGECKVGNEDTKEGHCGTLVTEGRRGRVVFTSRLSDAGVSHSRKRAHGVTGLDRHVRAGGRTKGM